MLTFALSSSFLALACLAPIGRYVSFNGVAEPSKQTRFYAPYLTTVVAIKAKNGELLNKGDFILELDSSAKLAEAQRLRNLISKLRSEILFYSCLSQSRSPNHNNSINSDWPALPANCSHESVAQQSAYPPLSDYRNWIAELNDLSRQRYNSLNSILEVKRKILRQQLILRAAEEKIESASRLYRQGALSKFQLIDLTSSRIDAQATLSDYNNELRRSQDSLLKVNGELRLAKARYSNSEGRLRAIQLTQQLSELNMQLQKLDLERKSTLIRSPYSAFIQDSTLEVGSVVQAGQLLFALSSPIVKQVTIFIPTNVKVKIRKGDHVYFNAEGLSQYAVGDLSGKINSVSDLPLTHQEIFNAYRAVLPEGFYYSASVMNLRSRILSPEQISRLLKPGLIVNGSIKLSERSLVGIFLDFSRKKIQDLRDN